VFSFPQRLIRNATSRAATDDDRNPRRKHGGGGDRRQPCVPRGWCAAWRQTAKGIWQDHLDTCQVLAKCVRACDYAKAIAGRLEEVEPRMGWELGAFGLGHCLVLKLRVVKKKL
jgi:hypothetical protein